MIRNKVHIIFIVVFQLLVYLSPHVIKTAHHHSFEKLSRHGTGNSNTLSKSDKGCPICKFEFVTAIAKGETSKSFFQHTFRIKNTEPVHQIYKTAFSSCELRAPPIA